MEITETVSVWTAEPVISFCSALSDKSRKRLTKEQKDAMTSSRLSAAVRNPVTHHEGVWENGSAAPFILNFDIKWRWETLIARLQLDTRPIMEALE